ncbi:hypothetical protein ANCDUO_11523 [Ancylostoma duodenale]|uniref:Receptor L-domain domain-containing protein n=1 Tax=Ancylostoma duodenale TaxID=51022 RepID=A0A0C2CNI5_9BILA|nr:hypothetical protein ANCDUO_11523 [Ancylostoma duodenale]
MIEKLWKSRKIMIKHALISSACGETRYHSKNCRVIEGILALNDPKNEELPILEELYGQIHLVNTKRAYLPDMPLLRKVEWRKTEIERYAIEIVNNTQLQSIAPLTKIKEFVFEPADKAVLIEGNPALCITPKEAGTEFVKKYASHILACGRFS